MSERIKIDKEWLEAVATIKRNDKRELFILSCVGYALGEHCEMRGFFDADLNALWKQTRIIKHSKNSPGSISLIKKGGARNG